ncbi:MAG: tetratricopeptide repeat protein, partial [Planctomycetota bacterium]
MPVETPAGFIEYLDGLEALADARYEPAQLALAKAVAANPSRAAFRRALAMSQLLQERVDQGVAEARRAFDLQRNERESKLVYALALRMKGDVQNAMMVVGPKSGDPYEKLHLEIGQTYAHAVMGRSVPGDYQQQLRAQVAEQRLRFPTLARLFAERARVAGDVGKAEFRRGYDRFHAGRSVEAERSLAAVARSYPADPTVLAYHGAAQIRRGMREQGRRRLSTALSWLTALPSGYQQRGIAAAREGSFDRARADLAILRRLQPQDENGWAARLEGIIVESEKAKPALSADALLDKLVADAGRGVADDALLDAARWLVFASNDGRRFGAETYQEKKRALVWRHRAAPDDLGRMTALAHFLIDEADVRREPEEPAKYHRGTPYREANQALRDKELGEARTLCAAALKRDSGHAMAHLGFAKLAVRERKWRDAEISLKRALARDPKLPEALELLSHTLKAAADQKAGAAAALRRTHRWSEVVGRWRYHYVRYPSAAELRLARQYDRQASAFLQQAMKLAKQAIAVSGDTPEGLYLVGSLAWRTKNYEKAYRSWAAAVQAAPDNRAYRYSLANVCGRLGRIDEWIRHTSAGRNLEHTTASAYLWHAWDRIMARDWSAATKALRGARNVDPADARIPIYMGIVAEGQGRGDEAIARYRAGLALCRARQWYRGVPEKGRVEAIDVARGIAVRLRLGELLARRDPARAAAVFAQVVALEPRVGSYAFSETLPGALLPDVRPGRVEVPVSPVAGALFREARARTAI